MIRMKTAEGVVVDVFGDDAKAVLDNLLKGGGLPPQKPPQKPPQSQVASGKKRKGKTLFIFGKREDGRTGSPKKLYNTTQVAIVAEAVKSVVIEDDFGPPWLDINDEVEHYIAQKYAGVVLHWGSFLSAISRAKKELESELRWRGELT